MPLIFIGGAIGFVLCSIVMFMAKLSLMVVTRECPRVKLVKLCEAEYAKSVLTTDRHISCLMPCSMAVCEGDDGKVYLSEINKAIMAKMFGGNIAKVVGEKVVHDEKEMLRDLLK